MSRDPGSDQPEVPLIIDDPAPSRLRDPRSPSARAAMLGGNLAWIALGLIGISVATYAVRLGMREYPAETPPAAVDAAAPVPPQAASTEAPKDWDRPEATHIRPRPKRKAQPSAEEVVHEDPPSEPAKTASAKPAMPDDEDPAKAFETGAAFDSPRSPDRNGRPGISSFENPTGRPATFDNPPSSNMPARASTSDRPNVPDPSFNDPPPSTKPARKRGRR